MKKDTKLITLNGYLALLRGLDMEMDDRIRESFENLFRTRDCITHQLASEPKITINTMIEALETEVNIYEDFANDLLATVDDIRKAIDAVNSRQFS